MMAGVIGPGIPDAPSVSATVADGSRRPVWSWTEPASHFAGEYRVSLDDDTFSSETARITGVEWSPEEDLSVGSHTLYVQARGTGGLWSDSGSATQSVTSGEEFITDAPVVSVDDNETRPTWSWTKPTGGNGIFRFELNSETFDGGHVQTKQQLFRWKADLSGSNTLYVQAQSHTGAWSPSGSATRSSPYGDNPSAPESPLPAGLQTDLELELLGGRDTNDSTTFWDSSGNGRHATAVNGFTVDDGRIGNGLYGLASSTQRLDLAQPSGGDIELSAVSFWVYDEFNTANVSQQIMTYESGDNSFRLMFCGRTSSHYDDETGALIDRDASAGLQHIYIENQLSLGWHHVVCNRTLGANVYWEIWINGEKVSISLWQNSGYRSMQAHYGAAATIGAWTSLGFYYDTHMDLVRFWSRTLSDGEISQLYNSGDGL